MREDHNSTHIQGTMHLIFQKVNAEQREPLHLHWNMELLPVHINHGVTVYRLLHLSLWHKFQTGHLISQVKLTDSCVWKNWGTEECKDVLEPQCSCRCHKSVNNCLPQNIGVCYGWVKDHQSSGYGDSWGGAECGTAAMPCKERLTVDRPWCSKLVQECPNGSSSSKKNSKAGPSGKIAMTLHDSQRDKATDMWIQIYNCR